MKKDRLEKMLDNLIGAGNKSGGILGIFTKNIVVTGLSIIILLTMGSVLFLTHFGKGFHRNIKKSVDPHFVV
jgi:hypothetical protein